jgi:hypothetical protein
VIGMKTLPSDDSDSREFGIRKESTLASQSSISTERAKDQAIQIKLTLPNTNITFAHDMQGIDETLFTLSTTQKSVYQKKIKERSLFHCHTYTLVDADFFNAYASKWEEKLLLKP